MDHKEVLRILSSPVSEDISEVILRMVNEVLNEKYVSRDCKKKNGETGHCAMISHKTHKQKACYDDCDTARAATHLEEDEELDEISSAAGGAAGGFSLPLGEKPTFFKDEHPALKGTMPGIKLIYKRRDKRN